MISDVTSLTSVLVGFESTLKIEYSEYSVDKIIKEAKARLENAYQIKLDKSIYDLQATNSYVADTLNSLVMQVADCMNRLAGLQQINMFYKSKSISLASVNFLGYEASKLRTALKYLQSNDLYTERGPIIRALRDRVSQLGNADNIKRLFTILFMLEELGIFEAVASVAQFLYVGGLNL